MSYSEQTSESSEALKKIIQQLESEILELKLKIKELEKLVWEQFDENFNDF